MITIAIDILLDFFLVFNFVIKVSPARLRLIESHTVQGKIMSLLTCKFKTTLSQTCRMAELKGWCIRSYMSLPTPYTPPLLSR